MKQKTAIMLSIAVTAFLLVVTGAVAALATEGSNDQTVVGGPTLPPEVEEQISRREADYQAALEEANQKLEEAYQTIEAMEQESVPTEAPDTVVYPVSPELAVGLALNLVPDGELEKWPELVNFQGTVAYEIILEQGAVYISATDAILLHNGAANSGTGGDESSGSYDDDYDDDHDEEDEHDEHDD